MLTEKECKMIIFDIAMRNGVSPMMITTRLLSKDDLIDLKNEILTIDNLEAHIKLWIENGKPKYV